MQNKTKVMLLLILAVITRLFFAWILLHSLNYEEAGVGLMAHHILQGDFIALWWGQPYGGTLEIYFLAFLFLIFGSSVWVLHLSPLLISLVGVIGIYCLGRRLFNEKIARRALLFMAVPPLFLMRYSLIPYSGYLTTIALGVPLMLWTYNLLFRRKQIHGIAMHYFGIGFFCGLLIWQHLIGISFIAATLFLFMVHERRFLISPGFLLLGVGIACGALPLLVWNMTHEWSTFSAMVEGHVALQWFERLKSVVLQMFPSLLQGGIQPPLQYIFMGLYVPVGVFLLFLALRLVLFLWDKTESKGALFLSVYFFAAVGVVVFSRYDLTRYLFPIYVTLPLLFVYFWSRWDKPYPWLAPVIMLLLIGTHVTGLGTYAYQKRSEPKDPSGLVFQFLEEQNIEHVYAHYRVAWPLSFRSQEKIIASDIHSFRDNRFYEGGYPVYMTPFFREGKAVDQADKIAFITHEGLHLPAANKMERALNSIGAKYKIKQIPPYSIFYDIESTHPTLEPISLDEVILRSSSFEEDHLSDGHLSTWWQTDQKKGEYIEIEFKHPTLLKKISLLTSDLSANYPQSFIVQTSTNGKSWNTVLDCTDGSLTLDWFGESPRFNVEGDWHLYLPSEKIRFARIVLQGESNVPWSVAELLLYSSLDKEETSKVSEACLAQAVKQLKEEKIEWVYPPESWIFDLEDRLPRSVHLPSLFEARYAQVKKSSSSAFFNERTAFILDVYHEKEFSFFLSQHEISFKRYELGQGWLLYVVEPHALVGSRIWKHQELFQYFHLEEARRLYREGEKALEKKYLGLAKKYFQASMDKFPTSFAYFKIKECLKQLGQEKEKRVFEAQWKFYYEPQIKRNEIFSNKIRLSGVRAYPASVRPGDKIKLGALWECLEPIDKNLIVFVHFEGPDGIAFQADHIPDKRQTTSWLKQEIIADYFDVIVPNDLAPGKYVIYIGWWDLEKRWPVYSAEGNKIGSRLKIGEIVCEKRP